jgi:hypothetical protein
MATATIAPRNSKAGLTVLARYDVAADDKKRINLRGAKTKYFHVQALSNGSYVLEPLHALSPRARRMLDNSVAGLKKGRASAAIDLSKLT